MKGMLKKAILSLTVVVLTAALLPVSALGADITVNCMDLTVALAEGQGIGFHETSPDSLDNAWYKSEFSPIEVDNSYQVLMMRSPEWVKYQVTANEAGFYAIGVDYGSDQMENLPLTIRTDDCTETVILPKTASVFSFNTLHNLGHIYLKEGINDVYVDNKSGTYFQLRNLYLTKDNGVDWNDITLLKQATAANEALAESAVSVSLGRNRVLLSGNSVSYDFDIKKEGKYRVKLLATATTVSALQVGFDGEAAHTADSSLSADMWDYAETDFGVFALSEGVHTLSLSGASNYYLAHITLEYVGSYLTALESASVLENSVIPRGTDYFEFIYNDLIEEVSAEQVSLSDGSKNLPLETLTEDNKLTVYLTETLSFATDYTITLQGVKGIYDERSAGDSVILFTTSNTATDSGNATLTVTEADNDYEVITVKGTVLSGVGKGISGRTVELLSSNQAVASCVTEEDGAFTLNFSMPEDASAQLYTYSVKTDYATSQTVQIHYITRALETEILAEFASAADASAVSNIFRLHRQDLGLQNYASDLRTLPDRNLFFNHFAGTSFLDIKEVRSAYTRLLAVERLNQCTDSATVKQYLSDESVCNTIGLDYKRFSALQESLDLLIAEYLTLPVSQSEDAFLEKCNTLLEKWLKIAYQKADVTLLGNTHSVTVGQALSVPVGFSAPQSDVKQLKLNVTLSDAALLTNLQLSVDEDAQMTSTVSGNVLSAEISYETPKTATAFGSIQLVVPMQNNYTVTMSGTLDYEVSEDVIITVNMNEATVLVTASQPNFAPSNPSFGGGGGGGGGAPSAKPTPVPGNTRPENQTEKAVFQDLSDVAWAEDMILSLCHKGIISKSEDALFRPNDAITREEYVKLIVMATGSYEDNLTSALSDVPSDSWASSYIASAEKSGLIRGNENRKFGLGEKITRQDMAVILYRVFERLGMQSEISDAAFSDAAEIADYAKDAVNMLCSVDIISGMGDNTFRPKMTATRAQAAKMIYKLMEVLGL